MEKWKFGQEEQDKLTKKHGYGQTLYTVLGVIVLLFMKYWGFVYNYHN